MIITNLVLQNEHQVSQKALVFSIGSFFSKENGVQLRLDAFSMWICYIG